MANCFDSTIVDDFIHDLDMATNARLLADFGVDDPTSYSRPFRSFCFYTSISDEYFSLITKKEESRSLHVTGTDIFCSSRETWSPDKERLLAESRKLLRSVWPDLDKLFEQMISWVSFPPFDQNYESASNPQIFGQISYRMDNDNPLKWAEIIAHETAHHYLFCISSEEGFLDESILEARDISALRNESRPLIGILHAFFAETFICQFAIRLIDCRASHQYFAQSLLSRHLPCFRKDFETLKKYRLEKKTEKIAVLAKEVEYVATSIL